MGVDLTRRAFLFRKDTNKRDTGEVRLPWLKNVDAFLDKCTQCEACLEHCPEKIIVKGDGGYPSVDFNKGECTFCQECTQHCPEDLFDTTLQTPWNLDIQITQQCFTEKGIVCQSCADACEPRAIKFSFSTSAIAKPNIDESACTGCGACVGVCPTNAIVIQQGIPNE